MKTVKIADTLILDRLGEVTLHSIESFHTIVVVKDGKYYRMSGLGLEVR